MTLNIQSWLMTNNGDYDKLYDQLAIKANFHPTDSRVILNYDQIKSPKFSETVKDCRGLVLDRNTYKVIARSFRRFYNWGEQASHEYDFDWKNCIAQEKADGSLILLYKYNGKICVNTRNSYGDGEITPEAGMTWTQTVFNLLPTDFDMEEGKTYVCELCTIFNKVVRTYSKPRLFLLSAFDNECGYEFVPDGCGIERISEYGHLGGINEIQKYITKCAEEDATFEGVVLKDIFNNRLKVKSPLYVELHHMKANGNLFMTKNILPFVLKGEADEVLVHFPEAKEKVEQVKARVNAWKDDLDKLWFCFHDLANRKKFAMKVKDHPLSAIMFKAKDLDTHPHELLVSFENTILKALEGSK